MNYMRKLKVYIASPYTVGDKEQNVRLQIDAFHELLDMGYIPIVPLLCHYLHEVRPLTDSQWLQYDFELLRMCDFVVRLRPLDENEDEIRSTGADMEEYVARTNGIPVYSFYSISHMKESFRTDKP
jgi:hypothetical protein